MTRTACLVLTLLLMSAPCCLASDSAALTVEKLLTALRAHGFSPDTERIRDSVLKAVLAGVDPGARIVSSESLDLLDDGDATLESSLWPEAVFYMKVGGLQTENAEVVLHRIRDGLNAARTGFILDLRGAGGTDLGLAEAVASCFVKTETPLYKLREIGQGNALLRRAGKGHKVAKHTKGPPPLLLLINGDTHGASEILAGALKGQPGILLIGNRTKGDAVIREALPLDDGHFLYVATRRALWRRADQGDDGVSADVEVFSSATFVALPEVDPDAEALSESERVYRTLMLKTDDDILLQRSVDVLLGLRAVAPATQAKRRVPEAVPSPGEE